MKRLVVDTGVFSASLSRRFRPQFEPHLKALVGSRVLLATQSVAELRYGALVAGWGDPRNLRLEIAIAAARVIPVTEALVDEVARLRFECRKKGHPLQSEAHTADLWIAATARHVNTPLLTADHLFDGVPGLHLEPT